MFRRIAQLSLIFLCVPLSACASFDGQPRAVLQPVDALPENYSPIRSLERYAEQSDAASRRVFRNTVIGIYMSASDANFMAFRRGLSREVKGSNFGLGSAFTALTGGATIAGERTANILAAIASGVSGIQGRLSSEVYFERTLPALLTGMDANRTRVRTDIVARMGQDDQYTLTEAFLDLARYEAAGSLDGAIETITTQASRLRDEEQARFENVVGLGRRIDNPATRVEMRTLGNRIDALVAAPNGLASLTAISEHLRLPTNVGAEAQATNIVSRLQFMAAQDPTSLGTFVREMQQKGVDLSR
jgi:hypothetical protein